MTSDMKQAAQNAIEKDRAALLALSHDIHAHPELAFEERYAAKRLTDFLSARGFEVEAGIGTLETAFRARKKGGGDGPHIAFLAEYDALPGIGHGCGHNIIATCAIGAFLGAEAAIGALPGEISIIGTPGEEGEAGKVVLLENGVFDDVDFALMMHPSSGESLVTRGGRAATNVEVAFRGRAAHSSAPGRGINALSAVINTFQGIDLLRPTFDMQDNVNGIIIRGGKAANIIPDDAACEFSLRARTLLDLRRLIEKVESAVHSAAALTGAAPEIHVHRCYAERYPCVPICEKFKENMESLGEPMTYPDPNMLYGSSDVGNVSIRIPAIHDYLAIAPADVNAHSAAFTEAAASARADEVCIKGAKGLAITALDLLLSSELRESAVRYHAQSVPAEYRNEAK